MAESQWSVFARYQWILAGLHLFSASVFLVLISLDNWENDWKVDVMLHFNKWLRLEGAGSGGCTKSNPCIIRQFVDDSAYQRISLGVAVAFCSIISGIHHLFAAMYPNRYKNIIQTGIVWPRWIDYAFSSPTMFLVVAILWVSPPDIRDIIYVFAIQTLVITAGYGAECAFSCYDSTSYDSLHQWSLTGFAVAAHATVWGYLFRVYNAAASSSGELVCDKRKIISDNGGNLTNSNLPVYEDDPSGAPAWVNIILMLLFFTFSSFAVNHIYKLSKSERSFNVNLYHEAIYSGLSFTSKILLLGTLAASIVTRSDGAVKHEKDYIDREEDDTEDNSAYIGLGISAFIAIVFCARFGYLFSKAQKDASSKKRRDAALSAKLVF